MEFILYLLCLKLLKKKPKIRNKRNANECGDILVESDTTSQIFYNVYTIVSDHKFKHVFEIL